MLSYFNGKLIDDSKVCISPYDRGFLFGDGVYEVVRNYGGNIFYLDEHFERLANSLKKIDINVPNLYEIKSFCPEIIKSNNPQSLDSLLYIQITRGTSYPRSHIISPDIQPTVFVTSFPFTSYIKEMQNGIKVILLEDIRWYHCDIKSIGLLGSILGNRDALRAGATEALWVRSSFMTEGTHTNFIAIKNKELFTPPLNNFVLPGITRSIIHKLCNKLDIKFHEVEIRETELKSFDEMMVVGTASEIMPVVKVDDWKVGSGKPGEITKLLQKEFKKFIKLNI
jgi:D-alanine transaminase